jgi:hypothetical protein
MRKKSTREMSAMEGGYDPALPGFDWTTKQYEEAIARWHENVATVTPDGRRVSREGRL